MVSEVVGVLGMSALLLFLVLVVLLVAPSFRPRDNSGKHSPKKIKGDLEDIKNQINGE